MEVRSEPTEYDCCNEDTLFNIEEGYLFDLNYIQNQNKYGTFKSEDCSEYEVILEDGTKQKRTISLSSNFDINSLKSNLLNEYKKMQHKTIMDTFIDVECSTSSDINYDSKKEAPWYNKFTPNMTLDQKDVIKASIAHLIGTLFTFVPVLHQYVGQSSHLVAITCIFFNPGQSIGKFVENMIFGSFLLLFGLLSGFLSIFNMSFWNSLGYNKFANFSTWFIFIGGSSFFLARIKAQYSRSSVLLGTSASFMITYLVLLSRTPFIESTFEPSDTYDLIKALSIGILLNFFFCTQLWPSWESDKLKKDVINNLDSLRHNLGVIVKTFLLEENSGIDMDGINNLTKEHLNSLKKLNLIFETSAWEFHLDDKIIKSMNKLNEMAQKLNGLSSSIEAQKEILNLNDNLKMENIINDFKMKKRNSLFLQTDFLEGLHNSFSPDLILFHHFLKFIGPPTKSLTYTCKQAISGLIKSINETNHKTDINTKKDSEIQGEHNEISIQQLKTNINNALILFSEARDMAINELYSKIHYDGHPSEEIFLVYFFVYGMEDFAKELILTMDSFQELKENASLNNNHSLWNNLKQSFTTNLKKIKSLSIVAWNNIIALTIGKTDYSKVGSNDCVNEALHNPDPKTNYQRSRANFWYFLMSLRDYRVIFAFKSSIAALIISAPAYLFGYKELFRDWKVGWTLVAMNIVMSPTLGASNLYGLYRVVGTCVGSLIGYLTYTMFSHNVFMLILVTTLVTIPCMHIFLKTSIFRFGQFLLLCYNLIVLTAYVNNQSHDGFGFGRYVLIRATSVTVGVLFGLFFSLIFMPYEARRELRLGLSGFFTDLMDMYSHLAELYYYRESEGNNTNKKDYKELISNFTELELNLQKKLLELQSLLPNTAHEPRLKGAFPTQTYEIMLLSCQELLSHIHTIRMLVSNPDWKQFVIVDFLLPLSNYEQQLFRSLNLHIYILSTSLLLRTPLPPYLPPLHRLRKNMILAMEQLNFKNQKSGFDTSHITFYAFVVILNDSLDALNTISTQLKHLFGVERLHSFEMLFNNA